MGCIQYRVIVPVLVRIVLSVSLLALVQVFRLSQEIEGVKWMCVLENHKSTSLERSDIGRHASVTAQWGFPHIHFLCPK